MPKRKRGEGQVTQATAEANKNISKLVSGGKRTAAKAPGNGDATKDIGEAQTFTVAFKGKGIICERHGCGTKPALIFTHGAGYVLYM